MFIWETRSHQDIDQRKQREKKNEYIYIFIYFFTEELGKVGVGGYICLATRCFYPCSHFL